jgi:LmbE family N-acetylglucosaminyl deacetylase
VLSLFERILFVGAHVDDVELFAGGTIARFAENARVIAFSHHKGVRPSPPEEFQESMRILGVHPKRQVAHDLPACQDPPESFSNYHKWMYDELVRVGNVYQPTLVVTHQSTDTNQDHKFVHELVLRVFKRASSIICGEFWYNDFPPASRCLYVDVEGDCLLRKVEALNCYASQRVPGGRPYFNQERTVERARAHGERVHCEFAEAFEVIRLCL